MDYKQMREDKYKQESKDRLSKILKKKVETTMIGALASIEQHFGSLWNNKEKMTKEQEQIYDLYQQIRSEILDKGNAQARNIDAELAQYEVKWLRYTLNMPVKNL
jgi:transcription termination factor Rho